MPKVAIAIPARNAANSIGEVISQVTRFVSPEDVFVVDDGSSDQTGLVAREKGVWLLRHAAKRGKGSALRDATIKILERDYESVITLDSDLQHDPGEIPSFISASRDFDVVIGRRTISVDKMPVHRFLSNTITTKLISMRTGVNIEDSQCGYRLYKTAVLKAIHSNCNYYDYESDLLIKAALAGFQIGFVPIKTIYNDSKSGMRTIDILRFIRIYLRSFIQN
ncbi:MAG: glycosyltransferase family 2 protein [Bacteroidetes bacterium]|nr:glycosyltransferase family 2 protein [Bacteroidota bacterium]